MRPDFVSETNTPTLFKLGQYGVTFRNHHPVYISTTEVNGTALATGVYPEQSGVIGNKEFRPAINPAKKIQTESLAAVRKGDDLTGNRYLGFPTVAETLRSHGLRTVIAGAKGVTLLHDRAARHEDSPGINLFAGETLPESLARKLSGILGEFPPEATPRTNRDLWTTRALIGPLWQNGVPPFSLLWLSEPDDSQHEAGPGSPTALAVIKRADENLARVLDALDEKGVRESTDVIVLSDHGFSTIDQNADVEAPLDKQGFHARREFPPGGPNPGDILIVGNGGTVFLYVAGHDATLIEKVAHCLQAQPFCGVVFTGPPVDGAFRLRDVKPDKSANGTPGLIYSDYGHYDTGQGMHGSLSRFDMHNTCIAAGPDFQPGVVSDTPSGNIDIAPTILWILGVEPKQKLSGRVLGEAFRSTTGTPLCQTHTLQASYRGDDFTWRQYLKYSEVNGVLYFDEGNGEQVPVGKVGGS
jgi:arylsulfatase A-like enzyme